MFCFNYYLILSEYFEKRKSVVFSATLSGQIFAGMIAPPVFNHFLDVYGFTGAVMLLAGNQLYAVLDIVVAKILSATDKKATYRSTE